MVTLAVDTSAGIAVAVTAPGGWPVLAQARLDVDRKHAELLTPLIASVLDAAGVQPAEVSAVVAGTGPAPFTGLRAGLVTARAFAFARGIEAFGVCSLDAVAAQASGDLSLPDGSEIVVVADARRKELYWARYGVSAPPHGDGSTAQVTAIAGPDVARPAALEQESVMDGAILIATGPLPVPVPGDVAAVIPVNPAVLAQLAASRAAAGIEQPTEALYLRRPDVQVPAVAMRVS